MWGFFFFFFFVLGVSLWGGDEDCDLFSGYKANRR